MRASTAWLIESVVEGDYTPAWPRHGCSMPSRMTEDKLVSGVPRAVKSRKGVMKRISYRESCLRLQALLDGNEPPKMPVRMPRYDDGEPWGVSFFRTKVAGDDLSNLTLPRTYFGRSEISHVSFQNADLTESNLCWNDFTDVDFSAATLARCDLRSSQFDRVKFIGADLRAADMRHSWFNACIFDDAMMDGAVLTRAQATRMAISEVQAAVIDWRDQAGPEPDGG